MSPIKDLRAKLKKLNGLQWAKKRQLKDAIFRDSRKSISRLTKDMNSRRFDIRQLAWQVEAIKMSRSKNAYFQYQDTDGQIVGVHSVGVELEGQYHEEEIWANHYKRLEDGSLKMVGGSMRVQGPFEDVVTAYLDDPDWKKVDETLPTSGPG